MIPALSPGSLDAKGQRGMHLAWLVGDWASLATADLSPLQGTPAFAELSPYVLVGHLQTGKFNEARTLADLMMREQWGEKVVPAAILSSAQNSVANGLLVAGRVPEALLAFHDSLALLVPESASHFAGVRANNQARLLGVSESASLKEYTNTLGLRRPAHGILSHAQNFEDVLLWRALGHVSGGKYIDIGAQDPVIDSVSLAFYSNGWRGVHVEPSHNYAEALRRSRPDEIVIEAAVTWKCTPLTFYEIPNTGISSARPDIAAEHRLRGFSLRPVTVNTISLHQVFDAAGAGEVHWMKIDVEGLESEVLASWRVCDPRPWIVLIESTLPLTQQENYNDWQHYLVALGYDFRHFDGLNRYYVHRSVQHLASAFTAGPNVFDEFTLSSSSPFCGRNLGDPNT